MTVAAFSSRLWQVVLGSLSMPDQRRLLDTPLPQIRDTDLLDLIAELRDVTTVQPEPSYFLFGYLCQCLYPAGSGRRYKLEKDRLTVGRLLLRKIGSFRPDSDIHKVCDELARMQNQTAEIALNTALYVFLNKYLPDFEKKPKPWRYDPRDRRA